MADAAVTLASANVALVAGQILDRLKAALDATAQTSAQQLDQHATWNDIQVHFLRHCEGLAYCAGSFGLPTDAIIQRSFECEGTHPMTMS